MNCNYIIGICGGSGSGKTYFLKKLMENFREEEVCLLSQDHYYKPIEEQLIDDQGIENFDVPEAINYQLFLGDLRKLKKGELVEKKEYTFNKISSPPKTLFFKPAPVVIVEGIFIFLHEEIEKLIDLKIFIEAPGHLKLKRRILRDNTERGYDLDDVLYRYEYHVAPTFEKYIEPYKNRCDLIIPNNQDIQKPVDVMIQFIRSKLGN